MKKIKRIFAVIMIMALSTACLIGCDNSIGRSIENVFSKSDIVYQASTRFLYSTDAGESWSETIQEVSVNETYYLAIEMQVSQSEETKDEKIVTVTVTIPSTTVLDCYLDDHPGVSITGDVDSVNNSVSYDLDIVASTSPSKFRVVFECKPLSEGRTTVEVVYDDNVSSSWDASGTIKYVDNATTEEVTE